MDYFTKDGKFIDKKTLKSTIFLVVQNTNEKADPSGPA